METDTLPCFSTVSTAYLQNYETKSPATEEFPYQAIIAVAQAIICSGIAYLTCFAKSYLSAVTLAALILFELTILATGVGLYLGFRDNHPG